MAANFTRRSRHGSGFYFRRRIPNDLHAIGLPRQIVRSLHTADRREATVRARRLAVALDSLFARIRAVPKSKDGNEGITFNYMIDCEVDGEGRPTKWTVKAEEHETEAVKEVLSTLLAARAGSAAPVSTGPTVSGPTLTEALTAYRADKKADKKLNARSAASYSRVLLVVEETFGSTTKLKSITQERFVAYATAIKAKDSADKTKNSYITNGKPLQPLHLPNIPVVATRPKAA